MLHMRNYNLKSLWVTLMLQDEVLWLCSDVPPCTHHTDAHRRTGCKHFVYKYREFEWMMKRLKGEWSEVKWSAVQWSAVNWGEGCCGMSVAFMCSYVWVLLYSSLCGFVVALFVLKLFVLCHSTFVMLESVQVVIMLFIFVLFFICFAFYFVCSVFSIVSPYVYYCSSLLFTSVRTTATGWTHNRGK